MDVRARSQRSRRGAGRFRLWALVPLVAARPRSCSRSPRPATRSPSLVGDNPPPADEFDIRRVEFQPGEIRIRVTNPQPDDLTIATVTVDDAIVPYTLDGPETLGRLRSSTIVVPYEWVEDEPIVGRRHQLDRDPDDGGDRRRRRDARGVRAQLPRLRR